MLTALGLAMWLTQYAVHAQVLPYLSEMADSENPRGIPKIPNT